MTLRRGGEADARPGGHARSSSRCAARACPTGSTLTLKREVIQIKSVKSRVLEKRYGYLRITQFQERTEHDAKAALAELEKESGGLQRPRARPAQQSRRSAVAGGEGVRPVPRLRPGRLHRGPPRESGAEVLRPQGPPSPRTSRWWCSSTAAAPARRRSSRARCRTTSAPSCSARRPSARARCRPSCRWPTATRRSA